MNRKSKYIEFCEKHEVPLQVQPWWLDCVCGGRSHWNVALSFDKGGNLTGAIPYFFTKRMGLKIIKMPPLTDYTGVVFNFDNQQNMKPYGQAAFEQKVIADLVEALPSAALFYQQFYPEFGNWLPFLWQGFRQTTTYTYRLEDLSNTQKIFDGFKSSVRTNIRKASQIVSVETSENVETFYQIYRKSLERRQIRAPFSFTVLQELDKALSERNQRKIFIAKSKDDGTIHAALYTVWDVKTAYFLLWGIEPACAESHAIQFVFWEAIQSLALRVHQIDFCGSIIPSMERMIRSFGGTRRPCYCIYKIDNKWLEVIMLLFNRGYH